MGAKSSTYSFRIARKWNTPLITELEFRVWGLDFRVWCSGFRHEGFGFRIWGLEISELNPAESPSDGLHGNTRTPPAPHDPAQA